MAQDPSGRLLQVVDGQFLPVNEANGLPQLYIAAPNLNNFPPGKMGANPVRQQTSQDRSTSSAAAPRMRQPTLSISIQIQALEKQYSKLEQESRDLDKVEVLQRPAMTTKSYQQLVSTRRELVTRLNDIRISIKDLKDQQRGSPDQVSPQADEHSSPPQQHMPSFAGIPMLPQGHMPQGNLPGWSFDGLPHDAQGMMAYPGQMPVPPELGYFMPQPGMYPGQMPQYPSMPAPSGPFPPMFNLMGMPPAEAFHGYANIANAAPQMFPNQVPLVPTGRRTDSTEEVSKAPRNAAHATTSSDKESPRRSHALEIRNPEVKLESGQGNKSSLNPMSPSYQPASLSTKPSTPQSKPARTQAESPSPALAEAIRAHNSWVGESRAVTNSANSQRGFRYESSNASFATADFFPNNPRDHSVNKQAYPIAGNRSMNSIKRAEEGPFSDQDETLVTPEKEHHNPNWNPTIPDAVFDTLITPPVEQEITVAPPGTPTNGDTTYNNDPVSNRSQNNMSPKSRRPDLIPSTDHKSSSEVAMAGSDATTSAPGRPLQERSESSSSSRLPTSNSGSAYMEGFRAGEARLPIGPERAGVWLDGYCAGLRASMNTTEKGGCLAPQAASKQTVLTTVNNHTPSTMSKPDHPGERFQHHPHEVNVAAVDTLKEAVFSSQNENVLLSPDSNATAPEDATRNLGGWSKQDGALSSTESVLVQMRNGQASFPERTSSMVHRQLVSPAMSNNPKVAASGGETDVASEPRRNFSVQSQPGSGSQPSYLRTVYPGNRVLSSQLEWKSGSIAQVAGLAHGYVSQYDGMLNNTAALADTAPLTRTSGNVGTVITSPNISPKKTASPQQTRFAEGSMRTDDHAPMSSPSKKSPTKAKFAQIAGKAGIKVRIEDQQEEERSSPKEKARWRDVWRKGH